MSNETQEPDDAEAEDTSGDRFQHDIEDLRGEIIAEIEASTLMKQRQQKLLVRVDVMDKRYRDRVAALESEVRRLKARVRELEHPHLSLTKTPPD